MHMHPGNQLLQEQLHQEHVSQDQQLPSVTQRHEGARHGCIQDEISGDDGVQACLAAIPRGDDPVLIAKVVR